MFDIANKNFVKRPDSNSYLGQHSTVSNVFFNFMNEEELIYKYQFGFRQKHSTQQAIKTLVILEI